MKELKGIQAIIGNHNTKENSYGFGQTRKNYRSGASDGSINSTDGTGTTTGASIEITKEETPQLEVIKTSDPIHAFKALTLSAACRYRSIGGGHDVSVEGVLTAECKKRAIAGMDAWLNAYVLRSWGSGKSEETAPDHKAPHVDCSCGFYGVKKHAIEECLSTYSTPTTWLAEIYLSGTVIEFEKGYRAEKQEIIALYAPPTMPGGVDYGRWNQHLNHKPKEPTGVTIVNKNFEFSCNPEAKTYLPFSVIASELGIEVRRRSELKL